MRTTITQLSNALLYQPSMPMRVRVPDVSAPAPMSLIERLATCLRLGRDAQRLAPPAYQVSGEWLHLLDVTVTLPAGVLRESLNAMFRDSGHTPVGASYSVRGLTGFSPVGLLKRRLILQGMERDLRIWKSLTGAAVSALDAPAIGSPWGVEVDGCLLYPGVCRAHYFAQHIAGLANEGDIVAEIGGGYGELAYRLLRMKAVHYVCFDLPDTLLRSSYFLSRAFPQKRILLFDELGTQPLTRELIEQYDIVLAPNFLIPKLEAADITVNTRSLSEMSRETVHEYIRHINRFTRRYFVHENSNEAVPTFGDHFEIPAREFPLTLKLLSAQKAPWSEGSGANGRYVQYLYQLGTSTPV
jgi:hypothetical protein